MKRQAIVLAVVFSAFLFASCEDAVSDGPGNPSTVSVAVTGVTLDRENLTLMPGSKKTLSVTVEPEDAANTAVTWESDDEDVAVVDENGGVTGIAEGTAVITVATADGGFTAVCVVTVDPTIISVTGVSIGTAALHSDDGGLWIKEGEIAVLTAAVSPPEASNEAVIWESSNPETAEVGESNGNIIGVAAGSTTITVTTADGGFTDTCVVTVKPRVTGVTLDHGSITLAPEESKPLAATVAPEGAPNRSVTWESDKTAVATVDEYGTVTGVAVGKAKVTVTTADGGFTDRCEVTVTGVSLDYDHVAIAKGATTTLTATVLPEDAADKSVTWSSNKEDVATVDGNGMVTGVGAGSATITATMTASGYTAECVVEVYEDHVYAVNGTETWDNALAAISEAADGSENSPRVFVLQVTGDFGVRGVSISDSSITGTYKEVWLTGDGTISLDFTIEGAELTSYNSIIVAAANQTFVIDGPTLKGNAEHSCSLVYIKANSIVELRSGNFIGNTNCNNNGPGVYTGGTFTMKGGTISGNNGGAGGGVYVTGGTFTMDGGTITGNGDTSYDGGGVNVSGGIFIMKGGSITNNTASYYGGGVYCHNNATFIMKGGTISGNTTSNKNTPNGVSGSYTYEGGEIQED